MNKILETLAVIRAEGQIPLSEILAAEAQTFGRNVTVIVVTPSAWTDWVGVMRDMRRRGMHPMSVLLDARTFGSSVPSDEARAALVSVGVPVYSIKKGDDIANVLSEGGALTRPRAA